ncbi:hypothetical protein ACGC1H_002391 [Rhizoctonia solani]
MRDIPAVAEVPLNALMDAVLPAVSQSRITSICDLLLSNNRIQDPDEDPRWLCLPVDPKSAGKHETYIFSFLETVAEMIELQSTKLQSKQKLKVTGAAVPLSRCRNMSRPDGYFLLQPARSVGDCWADMVMPMELKNADNKESKIDDYAKVIWSMHHIMRSDARRRFVHGLTCENTKVKLWYNDRCNVVASEEFDVNKDWRILVRIILSIQQATAAELGYDPNMVSLPSANPTSEPQYDITIHNSEKKIVNVYRTLGIISDVGADSMVGRGTRVWKVQKVENGQPGGPTYALKMVWVHKDSFEEHAFVKRIKDRHTKYSQYFLTAIDYGFAPLDPANPSILFDTHKPLGRARILEPTGNYLPTH